MSSKTSTTNTNRPKKRPNRLFVFIFSVFKILFVTSLTICIAAGGLLGGLILGFIKTSPTIKPEDLELKNITSFIYDSKNNQIASLKGSQNRVLVEHNVIPDDLRDAFIAIEDKRFYDHNGIDIIRIGSAVVNFLKPGGNMHGGSTITQQLVRNITEDRRISLKRKVQEQYMATQLEKHLSKEKILDLYMNLIFMGGNYYGVQASSKAYFGKDVKDLTLAQCASLAGITNYPGLYAPVSEKTKKKNQERQKLILAEMKAMGKISEEEYKAALKEDLKFVAGTKTVAKAPSSQSYFVDQVILDVKKDLMAQGMSSQLADMTIYGNGIKIYTTLDPEIQKSMDDVYMDEKYFPIVNSGLQHPESSMVIIDPYTGHVKALRGGYGEKNGDLILNRATQIKRQPGSTFKPIAVYAPAIDTKLFTAATVVDDAPVYLNPQSKKPYPQNYSQSYSGLTTIHKAIINSLNVVSAQTWMKLGPTQSLKYLKRSGIPLDIKEDGNVSIAMGGLHDGVSPLQMAAAYAPFVNDGIYNKPITYTKVLDKEGNVLLENKNKSVVVYDNEGTSFIMTKMMQDVCKSGTAYPYGLINNGKMPSAGKTGTTSHNRDKWFVGYTPYYVGATWYGYDKNYKLISSEYSQALKIWQAVMQKVHANLPVKDFNKSSSVVSRTICAYSGKTPSDLCARDQRKNAIRQEYFLPGTEPKGACDIHVLQKVCKDSKDVLGRNLMFGPNCPSESMLEMVFTKRKTPPSALASLGDRLYECPNAFCTKHTTPTNTNTDTSVNDEQNQTTDEQNQTTDENILDDQQETQETTDQNVEIQ